MLLHRARTASAPRQPSVVPTPVHHPKAHPPKQPMGPQKNVAASTRPVFVVLFCGLRLPVDHRRFWGGFLVSWRPGGSPDIP